MRAIALALLLAGCAGRTAPPAPIIVPVVSPCVTGDIPDEPRRIRPELTGNEGLDIGIIAGSAIELRVWGAALRGMLEACRAPSPVVPPPSR